MRQKQNFFFKSVEAAAMLSSYHVAYCSLSPRCHVTYSESAVLSC